MSVCSRFEEEAIPRLEQDLDLDEHFSTCPDCVPARLSYDRLRHGLSQCGDEFAPPANWQAEVRSRLKERKTRRRPPMRFTVTLAAAATLLIGAVTASLYLITSSRSVPAALEIRLERDATTVWRGSDANLGDRIVFSGTTGGAEHAELRLYRNDNELLLRCSKEAPCTRKDDEIEAAFVLGEIGVYQSVLILSDSKIPEPSGSLDSDAGEALRSGARFLLSEEVRVR